MTGADAGASVDCGCILALTHATEECIYKRDRYQAVRGEMVGLGTQGEYVGATKCPRETRDIESKRLREGWRLRLGNDT